MRRSPVHDEDGVRLSHAGSLRKDFAQFDGHARKLWSFASGGVRLNRREQLFRAAKELTAQILLLFDCGGEENEGDGWQRHCKSFLPPDPALTWGDRVLNMAGQRGDEDDSVVEVNCRIARGAHELLAKNRAECVFLRES